MDKNDLRSEIIKKLKSEDVVDKMYGIEDVRELYPLEPPDDEILSSLIFYLKSDEVILQETASRVLGHYPFSKVAKMLVPFLNDPSIELRNAVNLVFHNFGNNKEVFDILIPLLKNEDEDTVIFVLDILIQVADEFCFESVTETIKHRNENVVLKAYEVIGSIGGKKSESFLLDQLKNNKLDTVQKGTIILQLSKFNNSELENLIINFEKEDETLLSLKCKSIGEFGSKESTAFLLGLLKTHQKKDFLLNSILSALAKISVRNKKDFESWISEDFDLTIYLNSGKPKVQKHAITILGVLKGKDYIDTLISFLKEDNKTLKENALDALADDESNKAKSIIRLMQYDSNQEVAMKARLIIQTKTLESE